MERAGPPVLDVNDSTSRRGGRPLHCGISIQPMSAGGQTRPIDTPRAVAACPLCSNCYRIDCSPRTDAKCHVWTAPSWQGFSSRLRAGRCSHVFGLLARHTGAAGHNALRASGPGQNLAFDNALAHVGCPDRRIDRLCITCCSPSQPSHRAGCRHDLVTPRVRRVPCSAHPWPSWPTPSSRSY
jgi:hypothetical protein